MPLKTFPYTFPFAFLEPLVGGKLYQVFGAVAMPGNTLNFFKDGRIQKHDSLKLRTKELLRKIQQPEISYRLDAADLSVIKLSDTDLISLGDRVRIIDEDLLIFVNTFVAEVSRELSNPAATKVQLETRRRTIASSLVDITKEQVPQADMEIGTEQVEIGWEPGDDEDTDPPFTLVKWQHEEDETAIDGAEIFSPSIPPETVFTDVDLGGTLDGWVYPETTDMDASKVRLSTSPDVTLDDLVDAPTGKIDPAQVLIEDGDPDTTLEDWIYPDSPNIDGEKIEEDTRQWWFWGKIDSSAIVEGVQYYEVEKLDGNKEGLDVFFSDCRVLDDSTEVLGDGTFVQVSVPTEQQFADGYPHLILASVVGGADVDWLVWQEGNG